MHEVKTCFQCGKQIEGQYVTHVAECKEIVLHLYCEPDYWNHKKPTKQIGGDHISAGMPVAY